jgi:RNAse (barnase) inhibitor barstar
MAQEHFIYGNESTSNLAVVRAAVPANIVSKQALFAALAKQLSFPDYFGENWDAFDECVRDLSWLPIGQVVLTHADIPLVNDVANARIYIAILRDAAHKLFNSEDHQLSVIFPAKFQAKIEWLLRSQRAQDAKRPT